MYVKCPAGQISQRFIVKSVVDPFISQFSSAPQELILFLNYKFNFKNLILS